MMVPSEFRLVERSHGSSTSELLLLRHQADTLPEAMEVAAFTPAEASGGIAGDSACSISGCWFGTCFFFSSEGLKPPTRSCRSFFSILYIQK